MKSLFILLLNLILIFAEDVAFQELTSANNLFTASIYKEILKGDKKNFLVSPFSVETVLALAQSGARHETAEEIRTSLRLPISQNRIESTFKSILPSLKSSEDYFLEVADKIYVEKNYTIKEEFMKIAADVFDADLENVDFSLRNETAKKMNEWVEKKTENKIHHLIDPDILDDNTKVILINALYFKGNWTIPFNSYLTKQANFYQTAESIAVVETMKSTNELYNYYENEELNSKFLEIPFDGENISMTIVLPTEKEGLAYIENQIEKIFLPQNYTKEFVDVTLPKFKIESDLNFKEILENVGVIKAFRDGEADFSGIAGEEGDIFIKEVIQKTLVDVNEAGAEAAAATYIVIANRNEFYPKYPPKDFIADHPFIFYIKVKELIIFAGRVLLPSY